ncbi:hypothetical protein [Albibacterium profundi]|uniref:Collagen-like protein n=1 Tax=Albibacterium profundi TaxID=3134906 RepID=A0ABV5CCP8_9SPHI
MKLIKYLVMIVLTVGLASCGKDGSVGPAGETGAQGADGVDGIDGRTILNGTANPTKDAGQLGDFYLNTNSYVLFGPKTASGWGSGKSILGAKGATGAKGDKGDTGAKGDKGDKGDTGAKGDKGEADYVILSGSTDPASNQGELGDFYYNTASKTLFYRAGVGRISTWKLIAKLANTIQFSLKTQLPEAGFITLIDIDLPFEVLERSVVNAYVQPYTQFTHWYPLPGVISTSGTGDEFLIYYTENNSKTNVRIHRQSGTGSYPNDVKLRILVTEADVFKTMSKKVDFNNYKDVNRYFKLGN